MPPTTPRVDLNKEVVSKAKQAMMLRQNGSIAADEKELERISFSATLSLAAESYTKRIVALLDQAGFRKHPPLKASEKRPRRVDFAVWEELGNVAKEQGIARMELVRALLVLLGDEFDRSQTPQVAQCTSVENAPDSSASSPPPNPITPEST